jgi:hypothetical protein
MENESGEQQLPAFTTANQNIATVVARLNALSATPTNDGGKVCQRLKSILGIVIVQQVESSRLHQAKAAILPPPPDLKDGGQKATQGTPNVGTTSSLEGFLACCRPGRPTVRLESPTHQQHGPGDHGMQFHPRAWNPH